MNARIFRQIVARKMDARYAGTASERHYAEMARMIRAGEADEHLGAINAELNNVA